MHSEGSGILSIDETDIRCIYTGKKLDCRYELDHFLPWRFVAHNQLWNLIPADSQANSCKSDQIPCEKYIDRLAETQSAALSIARDSLSSKKWEKGSRAVYYGPVYLRRSNAGLPEN